MTNLLGIARFHFDPSKVEEFKRLSAQCMEIVRTQDKGTVRYEIYLNEDESQAVVIEEYVDVAALMAHTEHIGEELASAIAATGSVSGEILGNIPAEMREQLEGGPVQPFGPFDSLDRQSGPRGGES